MKRIALLALLLASSHLLFAEASGAWLGYVTYAPAPVMTAVGLQDNDLKWLGDVAKLVGTGGSTFLGRRDADHWLSVTNWGKTWLVQIHDETARYNFWGSVQPKTGLFTVERGVEWVGSDRMKDAERVAKKAVGYLHRARLALDVFPLEAGQMKPVAQKAEKATVTDPAQAKPAPPAAGQPGPAAVTPTSMASPMAVPMADEAPMMKTPSVDPMLGRGGGEVWQKLVDGNLRFVSGKVTHPNQSMARVEEVAKGQHPFALVVASSDSQVPPEVLFDQGIGDLYVIRTAGAVVTPVELGSIEYAVSRLGVSLVVVLGNKGCDAVAEVLKGGDLPPNLEAVAALIRPAVESARFFKGDLLDNAVRENTRNTVARIQGTPALADAMKAGTLSIRAAYYDTDTARVAVLP